MKDKDLETLFFVYKDKTTPLVMVISFTPKNKVDKVLEPLIRGLPKSYFLWINPSDFNNIKDKILTDYPESKISSFIGTREPHYKNICHTRPNFYRRIDYKGEDGIESLRELEEDYGILPKKITFSIGSQVKFSMDHQNTFIIEKGYSFLDVILRIIQNSLKLNQKVNSLLETIKIEDIHLEDDNSKDVIISPLIIKFKNNKHYEDLEFFFNRLERSFDKKYCVINSYIKRGSLFFSATILDESKNSLFSLSGNAEQMVVIPKKQCNFDSLSRFYEKVVLSLDLDAKIIEQKNAPLEKTK